MDKNAEFRHLILCGNHYFFNYEFQMPRDFIHSIKNYQTVHIYISHMLKCMFSDELSVALTEMVMHRLCNIFIHIPKGNIFLHNEVNKHIEYVAQRGIKVHLIPEKESTITMARSSYWFDRDKSDPFKEIRNMSRAILKQGEDPYTVTVYRIQYEGDMIKLNSEGAIFTSDALVTQNHSEPILL